MSLQPSRLLRFTSRDCALQCVFSSSVPSTFSATPPLSLTTYVTQRLLGHKDRQTGPGCSWLGGTIYFWFWFFVLGWTHFLHSLKSFPLKPSRCRGCTFESKASAGLQGTGEGEKAGEATISFSSGDYHFYFFLQYLKNVLCSIQNNNPFKLQKLRHFTLNLNGCRMTTMMIMRAKTFCKGEKSGLGNSRGVILSNVSNLGQVGDLTIW